MDQKTLGEFIRVERNKRNWSLRELARRLGITPPFLSDIELGKRYPSPETLERIADEFGVSVSALEKLDHRESLADFKRLVETNPKLSFAFRTAMNDLKSGKITPESLASRLGSKPSK